MGLGGRRQLPVPDERDGELMDLAALARARARQRQAQIPHLDDKPPAGTIMTTAQAGLLVHDHLYIDGEQIGVAEVGDDRGMGYQRLVHENGGVIVYPGWAPVIKSRQAPIETKPGAGWSVQAGRLITNDDKA